MFVGVEGRNDDGELDSGGLASIPFAWTMLTTRRTRCESWWLEASFTTTAMSDHTRARVSGSKTLNRGRERAKGERELTAGVNGDYKGAACLHREGSRHGSAMEAPMLAAHVL